MVNRSMTSQSLFSPDFRRSVPEHDAFYKFQCVSLDTVVNNTNNVAPLFEYNPSFNDKRRISNVSETGILQPYGMTSQLHSVVILGELSVGKSALCRKYFRTGIEEGLGEELCDYDDINEFVGKSAFNHHIYERPVVVQGTACKIRILDVNTEKHLIESCACDDVTTIGRYAEIGDGCIVTYAVTDRGTFKTAAEILKTIIEARGDSTSMGGPVILVGNKCDLVRKRQVSTKEGVRLAEKYDVKFVETSASLNQNVDELFEGIISQIHLRAKKSSPSSECESTASSSGRQKSELLKRFRLNVSTTLNGLRSRRVSIKSTECDITEVKDLESEGMTSQTQDNCMRTEEHSGNFVRKFVRRLSRRNIGRKQTCQNMSVL
uniref:GTP-binding protein REM 1-like isoform X1 n=2 Tax=Ciona intestinalis TaxID=7719 RepID=UPI000180B902|nr:GTP-binding protein REM 1-like isoform X1 [Ciona intestinalis]|eukprot:XP_002128442.1 GTP-binding protein REM 1-like isoform X1 [Ciona intestinalis]